MDRYLKIGEQYVQWAALGIGGLYLLLMAYLYVFSTPDSLRVKIGSKVCTPDTVDKVIDEGDVHSIETRIGKSIRPDYAPATASNSLAAALVGSGPPQIPFGPEVPTTQIHDTGPTGPKMTLPRMPAPQVAAAQPSIGTSQIAPAAAPGAAAAAALPVAAVPPAGAAPAGAAAAPNPQPMVDWVSLEWTVNLDDMAKAMVAANLDQVLMTHLDVLRVELQRAEMDAAGNWSSPQSLPPMGAQLPIPMPSEKADADTKNAYLLWAAGPGIQGMLRSPAFPQVLGGTQWNEPGTPPRDADPFILVAPPAGGAAAGPAAPAAPGVPPGLRPVAARNFPAPFVRPGSPAFPGAGPAGGGAGDDINLAPNGGAGVPAGAPAQLGTLNLLTHDWTAQPGHTYRYRIRYFMNNTMFGQPAIQIPLPLKSVMALESPYGDWSGPVAIPTRFRVFVRDYIPRPIAGQPSPGVTFDVFSKKPENNGVGVARELITCVPGDPIGDSGWTFVDVRKDAAKKLVPEIKDQYYFLVADPAGKVQRRDLERDVKDALYGTLLERTNGAAAAAVP